MQNLSRLSGIELWHSRFCRRGKHDQALGQLVEACLASVLLSEQKKLLNLRVALRDVREFHPTSHYSSISEDIPFYNPIIFEM